MKTIKLGYVHMSSYSPGDDLNFTADSPTERSENPKEVVLPPKSVFYLLIDYPLETEYTQRVPTGVFGITRRVLVNKIVAAYKKIYANEEKYGIWGHEMSDLMLHSVNVMKDGVTLHVSCDS